MVVVESPAKVILFGEHAVVYGYRAISMAIDLKTTCTVEESDTTIINLKDLKKSLKIPIEEILNLNVNEYGDFRYVLCAIKNTILYLLSHKNLDLKDLKPFKLTITSQIPISCGLGSSASTTISTIKGISAFYERPLDDNEIATIGYHVEKEVQGKASVTDTATITYKGLLEIENNTIRRIEGGLKDFIKSCKFLICYCEERKKKTAELVNEVANHKNRDDIFKLIEKVVDTSKTTFDKEIFGELMYINHNLLKRLGVSTPKLDEVVEIGKTYGYGAKLTGAGGGGCVIILVNENKEDELINKLKEKGVEYFECRMVY
ncbi:mevalonate kinase [Methanotorris igneus]|uniref:Mevalonate kinase n=1 Tax=Methanotorris igneus (strain DSM 5666 / JCM 11834 / Kol 5) TaxID=880724 RepID=F6BA70_METIK|nr:mevalonate kinase [Methanotorris igneus]AEF95760.1 mevalonate kinase [Methanotorris igneus Kol 5]